MAENPTTTLAQAVLHLCNAIEQMVDEPESVAASSTLRNELQRATQLAQSARDGK